MPNVYRSLAGFLSVALVTVLAWWAWLGRDTTMNYDPATDTYSGPYTTGQVAGAVLTLLLLLIAAVLLRVSPLIAAAAMTISFVVAWTVSAASQDESGLFLVGAFLVTIGMTAGTALVAAITSHLRRPHTTPN
ncbi:MAG: hypothetical protein ABW000_20280 [Actinoplanes sp.]